MFVLFVSHSVCCSHARADPEPGAPARSEQIAQDAAEPRHIDREQIGDQRLAQRQAAEARRRTAGGLLVRVRIHLVVVLVVRVGAGRHGRAAGAAGAGAGAAAVRAVRMRAMRDAVMVRGRCAGRAATGRRTTGRRGAGRVIGNARRVVDGAEAGAAVRIVIVVVVAGAGAAAVVGVLCGSGEIDGG